MMTFTPKDVPAMPFLLTVVSHTFLTPHNLTNTSPTDKVDEVQTLAALLHGTSGLILNVNIDPVMLAHPHPAHSMEVPVIIDIALHRHHLILDITHDLHDMSISPHLGIDPFSPHRGNK